MKGSVALVLALVSCSSVPFEERLVATIPAGVDEWWVTVTPGGTGFAYAERRERLAYVRFEGRRYGPFP